MQDDWCTREEALGALGVAAQTLYAYASRGLIERRPDPARAGRSLYCSDDIRTLVARRSRGRRPAAIAASAIAWGEPVIATHLSTVHHGRLIYRGRDAAVLATDGTLEQVAALLWDTAAVGFPEADEEAADDPYAALGALAARSRPTPGRAPAKLCEDAARGVAALAAALGAGGAGAMHRRVARAFDLSDGAADQARRALVLLADHELNPSTFAARVAASTGASIAACLAAGLAALSGPRHGGAGAALAALVDEAERDGAESAVSGWLAAERRLPGFGHPLYPSGDPRAAALLATLTVDPLLLRLRDTVTEETGAVPNIDFALIALVRAADMPVDASFRLFAIARAVGWAAHAMEQAATAAAIRPRAVYAGALPAA